MKKKITGVYNSNICNGEITIISRDSNSVYANWVMYDDQNILITSFTNKYFIGDKILNDIELINMIAERILSYRIGRKRVFTEVKII